MFDVSFRYKMNLFVFNKRQKPVSVYINKKISPESAAKRMMTLMTLILVCAEEFPVRPESANDYV
jgi:hypothetical protein